MSVLNNPLVSVDITLCFEISNSPMFGGEGSTGYTSVFCERVNRLESFDEETIKRAVVDMAKALKVTEDDVKLITREEYEQNTEDESTECDDLDCE